MSDKKPLIIYDCDGTLEFPLMFAYGLAKQSDKTLTFADFKKAHVGDIKAMAPGMADMIRYTAEIGNNVLLSGGNPTKEGSRELKSLFGYFKNWTFQGTEVPFGKEPSGVLKDDPRVAEELIKFFDPSIVIVVGDSEDEVKLAENIKADVLLLQGINKRSLLDQVKNVPHKYAAKDGKEMVEILKDFFEKQMSSKIRTQTISPPRRNPGNDGR